MYDISPQDKLNLNDASIRFCNAVTELFDVCKVYINSMKAQTQGQQNVVNNPTVCHRRIIIRTEWTEAGLVQPGRVVKTVNTTIVQAGTLLTHEEIKKLIARTFRETDLVVEIYGPNEPIA